MMKKIFKIAVILLSAGIIATPAIAAEWGVSGQVRINWDVLKTSETKGTAPAKENTAGVGAADDNTYFEFTLKGDNASGVLKYKADGTRGYSASASAEEGDWSVALSADGGDGKGGAGSGSVALTNSSNGFGINIGSIAPLDAAFAQGASNLLQGNGVNDGLDNSVNAVDFSYKVSDALSVGFSIEQGGSEERLGKVFGSDSLVLDHGNTSVVVIGEVNGVVVNNTEEVNRRKNGTPTTSTGLRAKFSNDLLNFGFIFVSGSQAGDKDLGGQKDHKASASAIGLGLGLSLGALKPYVNIFNPTTSLENVAQKVTVTKGNTQIGVDFALGESSGVGLSIVSGSSKKATDTKAQAAVGSTAAVTAGTTEEEKTTSSIELGYVGKLGSTDFKVGYLSENLETKGVSKTTKGNLKVRFSQSF